jgi:hypothetical protein
MTIMARLIEHAQAKGVTAISYGQYYEKRKAGRQIDEHLTNEKEPSEYA